MSEEECSACEGTGTINVATVEPVMIVTDGVGIPTGEMMAFVRPYTCATCKGTGHVG